MSENNESIISVADRILEQDSILPEPRSLLLLYLCKYAAAFHSPRLDGYWAKLQKHLNIPLESMNEYNSLKEVIEGKKQKYLWNFVREIAEQANDLKTKGGENLKTSLDALSSLEARLRKKWWLFGKKPAWIAMIQAWVELDRKEACKRIGKLPRGMRKQVLQEMNQRETLSPGEWSLIQENGGSQGFLIECLTEMLSDEKGIFNFPSELAHNIGQHLLPKIHETSVNEAESYKLDDRREQALTRYYKLIDCTVEHRSEVSRKLFEGLFKATAETTRFGEAWPDKFTALRDVINHWVTYEPLRESGQEYVEDKTPKFLRDFSLTHWHAMLVNSPDDAVKKWERVSGKCSDASHCEEWFLIVLVLRGFVDEAFDMARNSTRSDILIRILRRAVLIGNREKAREIIHSEDVKGDLISEFLLSETIEEFVEFLRQQTSNGREGLPLEMWSRPDYHWLEDSNNRSPMETYSKIEEEKNQFKNYVRISGYRKYGYKELDPILLKTMIVWDDEHPDEVESLVRKMWELARPSDDILMADVIRNAVFERCRSVFCVKPELCVDLFVQWIKRKLVDSNVQRQMGETIYTLSLKETVPFLFCFLSAQKLANDSPKRCDLLLTTALKKYKAEENLMTAAAQLYSFDKALSALDPPVSLKLVYPYDTKTYLKAWQIGVVKAVEKKLLYSFIDEMEQAKEES